ncbi:uncharacterized protein LOC131038022 isoform X2 [Cryptomeria japonica]|uniref:uncharacterized protein LOC131038022 isoform X2 n=1 Tax=Cryptomeria japonica TaxID=3369 RepID=UPI0027DA9AC5|nr:uncharacterized protein LOC131038022 isoform X2 [Cryptomeria japonica]
MSDLASTQMKGMEETVNAMKERRSSPGEEETFPMPPSADTLPLHFQRAFVQPLSPNLFRVMRIVPDMQDYSFVEKIQLPQDEVIRLCNKLVPSSASASSGEPPRVHINFNSLNQQRLAAVGFYGDKNMIIHTFRKESLVDDSVLAKMEGRLFEPGLYVSLPDKVSCAVVFYWHEGEQLKQASRKDVSCNFIRYLVELCDSVYVYVEGNYPFANLAASATRAGSKTKRTKRIQFSGVKNSENDVELMAGYNLRIEGGANSEKTSLEPSGSVPVVNNHDGTVVFCEGYHYFCFLTTETRAARKSTKTEEVSVKASGFGNMHRNWSSVSNVDYSRLSDNQFIDLIENSQPQDFEKYFKFKESLRTSDSAKNVAKFQEFERRFLNVIPEFCPHVPLFVGGETSGSKLVHANESNSSSEDERFKQLQRELPVILAVKDSVCHGDQWLLLLGSDIRFVSSDGEHVIIFESLDQTKQTPPFISYGQEVDAKCSSQCGCSTKIKGKATFLQPTNGMKDFPLSGEIVKIVFFPVTAKSGIKREVEGKVHLVNKSDTYCAIRNWVENMVPIELKSIERNIGFTAFLLASDQRLGLTFIEKHLTTQNIQILPPEIHDQFEKFRSAHFAQSIIDLEVLLSSDTFKAVCCHAYKDSELKFKENIKELWTRLGSLANSRLQEAEDEFIQELKKKMSVLKEDNLATRYVEEVVIQRQSRNLIQVVDFWSSQTEQVELKLKVSIVEEHPFAMVYKACELTPMKKDLSDFNSNPSRPIVPTCGESVELVSINPQHERLFKVVVLKSRELMVFIQSFRDSSMYLYRCPKIGVNINSIGRPIHTFRRGFDLLAADEATRSIALYEKDKSRILIYKFDESFRKVYWTGVEVNLESYQGSKIIVWMHLIPGKMELLLVDDTNRARVVEIHEKPMMKARHISLPLDQKCLRACVSVDGDFLLVFRQLKRQGEDIDVEGRQHASLENILEIYVLGDTMSYLKKIPLNEREYGISDLEQLAVKIVSFGRQSQLLLYSPLDAPGFIFSRVLKTSLAKDVIQLQTVNEIKAHEDEADIAVRCPYLGYIYHIFDKFGTTPKLFPDAKKRITFKVVLERSRAGQNNSEACIKYLKELVRQLKSGKDKDFSNMEIQFEVNNVETSPISAAAEQETQVKMGAWVRKLVCLVPVQIARAENNALVALKDGLQIPPDVSYEDSVSLADCIRFGFYDAVLSSWKDKIKVISSMGKQSSGKSYLLNHLSGSLLDVAGGRCTDGVWMTIVTAEDGNGSGGSSCLYVLLDFEGLGSFERSEQEDMLLSVLNAAVSNITIFNKKDFHLDKETETAFSRFQSGINLLKQDKMLFKGLFYIAIKDVDTSDVADLIQEFYEKISQICTKQENFILRMYDGKVTIAAMAPYNRSEYYRESLRDLAETVTQRIQYCYDNGFTFLRDMKLIIAQIAIKDWTSIDNKRVAVTINILKRNLLPAVHMGSLPGTNGNEEIRVLHNFDTQEEIPDFPVAVQDISWNIKDSGLCLSPLKESATLVTVTDVLSQIRSKLEMILPRNGRKGDEWFSLFQKFLEALVDRRCHRVQQWIKSNTTDFCDSDEVQRLQLEANVVLGETKQGLSVCGYKCYLCFWSCVIEKGHDDHHDCMGSHLCTETCSHCARDGDILISCKDLAGHEGAHDCKERNHTCSERCYLYGMSSSCNKECSLRVGHHGQHKCNSPQHICGIKCSLPSCKNPCTLVIESNHIRHQCNERYCQRTCTMNECKMRCGAENHFHDLDPNAEHLCGNDHKCPEKCELGNCEIKTKVDKQTLVFQGQRGPFEYENVSQQDVLNKGCCIRIPPNKRNHEGQHVHTRQENCVHFCLTRCQSCGYFCHHPINHSGLHDTVHGNMRNVRFVSEEEDIDIIDRKYKRGEKGIAEMCNMFCKKQGRGHIHLVPCPGSSKCTGNLYDGSRHETVKYGPEEDVPKDEMTHDTFWQYVRFVDPCTDEERKGFDRCNHYCKSVEHDTKSGSFDKIYCTEKLWHPPIERSGQNVSLGGYITDDGHHFPCYHYKNPLHHVIFIIDRSGSMGFWDMIPTMAKFSNHNCRLGCVYEVIVRFMKVRLGTISGDSVSVVLFDDIADVAVEMEDMKEYVVDLLLHFYACGGTAYSTGLDAAENILTKAARHQSVKMKIPVVIFLSDGGNWGGVDPLYCVDRMKRQEPRMTLHTVMFGVDPTEGILIEMAKKGGGKFHRAYDEIQLARTFENLASSLKSPVVDLMQAVPPTKSSI